MIAAVVAEWQSCRPGAGRLTDELMAQADAEERQTPDQLPRYGDGGLELRRVTRSVGKNNAVRAAGEDPVEVAVVRQDLDLHPARAQGSQRVPLDAVIDDDDSQPRPLAEDAGGQRGMTAVTSTSSPNVPVGSKVRISASDRDRPAGSRSIVVTVVGKKQLPANICLDLSPEAFKIFDPQGAAYRDAEVTVVSGG